MNRTLKWLVGCMLLAASVALPQQISGSSGTEKFAPRWPRMKGVTTHDPNYKRTSSLSFYKRKSEWQKIIDSTWGSGLPLSQKLNVFEYLSDYISLHNPTFVYTHLNWDSVSSYWRAKINDSTSRGGFSAILSSLAFELHDSHSWAWDDVMSATPLNPGTPILVNISRDGGGMTTGAVSHFGAGLSVLPDSSLLVYMVVPNHPLGLEPGDVVLGYEGIPWRKLVQELMDAGIPRVQRTACSQSASAYQLLYCAGMNWHLFDTIDVVKHGTGQVLHLSTDPLIGLTPQGGLVNGAQLPVPGVPMPGWLEYPDRIGSPGVSYGIVQGTNIGYIYVYHHCNNNVGALFDAAVAALAHTHGLIIDIRFDIGGWSSLNRGIARLTNYAGPTMEAFARGSATDPSDLLPFKVSDFDIPQDHLSYAHPVAVLLGPHSASYGDVTAQQLTYLDNGRFFGKPPHAAFGGMWFSEPMYTGFTLECPDYVIVDTHSREKQLWGEEFPVDEHVWLTRDGVAKGEDDVVKRALEWMSTLTYAHDVATDRTYLRPGLDSVCITGTLANPLAHTATLTTIVTNTSGGVSDSLQMFNDGAHGDLAAGDSIWGCRLRAPLEEDMYRVEVRTYDNSTGTFRRLPNAVRFATAGPLTVDSVWVAMNFGLECWLQLKVRNRSSALTIRGAKVTPRCDDPWLLFMNSNPLALPDLAPGAERTTGMFSLRIDTAAFPGYFNLKFETGVDGWVYWTDSTRIITGVESEMSLPRTFALEQNYPNPFNPSTTIRYGLPSRSQVSLTVFNTLGQQVATLVQGEQEAGYHEVQFEAFGLASGVYLYRLSAGSFVETRKLCLVR